MSTAPNQIIPQAVLDGYTLGYRGDEPIHEIIAETCAKNQARQMAEVQPHTKPVCRMVLGPHGVGKSRLTKNIGRGSAISDADAIIPLFRNYESEKRNAQMHAELYYSTGQDAAWGIIKSCTERFRPWARKCADDLLIHCVQERVPVIFEATGKNVGITDLMTNVADTGMDVEVNLCLAPLAVLRTASIKHYNELYDFAISPQDIVAEHNSVISNAVANSQSAPGAFNLYWREQAQAPLQKIATGNKHEYAILDMKLAESFDRYMDVQGNDLTIADLMRAAGRIEMPLKVFKAPGRDRALIV